MDNKKKLIKIINETISEFDFLNMEALQEEEDYAQLVNSKNLQVQLINDLINNDKTKILDWEVDYNTSNIEDINIEDGEQLKYDFGADFNYVYDGKKIPLTIFMEGNVSYRSSGSNIGATHFDPPEYAEIDSVDYSGSNVTLYTGDGDEIDISWVEKNSQLLNKLGNSIVGLG